MDQDDTRRLLVQPPAYSSKELHILGFRRSFNFFFGGMEPLFRHPMGKNSFVYDTLGFVLFIVCIHGGKNIKRVYVR